MATQPLDPSWTIPRPGQTIADKYVVDGQCGQGGLAVVLSAVHPGLAQRVAIKMLLPEWAGNAETVERFLREGRAATRIKSEHVVRVFDVGMLDSGAPYLVLEYLEGHNFDDVLAMWGPLPVPTAIEWVLQAGEAIAEAHSCGIIHRDLKPANLFLTTRPDGTACVKVIDFGLSKLTDPGMCETSKLTRPTDVMGSPHYMAPEQLRSARNADVRADLWSLGAILHELLDGQPPFRGATMSEVCANVLTEAPPPLGSLHEHVPAEVERAVLRCLEKDPSARFSNMAELARALAPFGTREAQASRARIERVLGGIGSSNSHFALRPIPPPTPVHDDDGARLDDDRITWPSEAFAVRRFANTSMKVVVGSVFILAGLGAGEFLWMYSVVHSHEPAARTMGVTASQSQLPATMPALAPAPAAPDPTPTPAPAPAPTPTPVTPAPERAAAPPEAEARSVAPAPAPPARTRESRPPAPLRVQSRVTPEPPAKTTAPPPSAAPVPGPSPAAALTPAPVSDHPSDDLFDSRK